MDECGWHIDHNPGRPCVREPGHKSVHMDAEKVERDRGNQRAKDTPGETAHAKRMREDAVRGLCGGDPEKMALLSAELDTAHHLLAPTLGEVIGKFEGTILGASN